MCISFAFVKQCTFLFNLEHLCNRTLHILLVIQPSYLEQFMWVQYHILCLLLCVLMCYRPCNCQPSHFSAGYSYERLDGSVRGEERNLAIKNFSTKDVFIFLLSTKAGEFTVRESQSEIHTITLYNQQQCKSIFLLVTYIIFRVLYLNTVQGCNIGLMCLMRILFASFRQTQLIQSRKS